MKHERFFTFCVAFFLSFFMAFGVCGCLVSAFDLPLERDFLPVCLAAALICSGLFSFRHGGTALACLLALGLGYCFQDGRALQQLCQLAYQLSLVYDRAYGWGVLILSETARESAVFDWPVGILALLTALTVSRCISRQTSVWLPVLTGLLPLALCIVVTDTVPGTKYLLCFLAVVILLILTTSVRRENPGQGLQLTLAAALPVVLGLTALLLAAPQETYVNRAADLQEQIRTATQKIPSLMESGMNQLASRFQSDPPARVDLTGLGPRLPFTYTVMEVTAPSDGTLYLRGRDYDSYDGRGWTASQKRQEPFSSAEGASETLTIRTSNRKEQLFLPYYPQNEVLLAAGRAENSSGALEYTIPRTTLPENWRQLAYTPAAYGNDKWPQYCTLPEETRRAARELLEGLFDSGATHTARADIIAALVTDAAEYDLDPGKMPSDAPDFALWFLQEADSGYCVHFATAATVLLRAADVPARYVTGYMLRTRAGETVTVTEEDAHAWAEYYEPNLDCWIPLEVTPGTETEVPATQTRPPETTAPPETQPPTEEPTHPEPTEFTAPSTQPPEPTVPQTPASPEVPGLRSLLKGLLRLLLTAAALSLILLQRLLRIRLRRSRQCTGSPNRQALRRWQETEQLCRLLKTDTPGHLLTLAQKAKFSQYDILPQELQQFDTYNHSCRRQLQEKPWYTRWVYKYIFAAF